MAPQTPITDSGASTQPITMSTTATGVRQLNRRRWPRASPLVAELGRLGAETFQLSRLGGRLGAEAFQLSALIVAEFWALGSRALAYRRRQTRSPPPNPQRSIGRAAPGRHIGDICRTLRLITMSALAMTCLTRPG